jgi:hypothetical protein
MLATVTLSSRSRSRIVGILAAHSQMRAALSKRQWEVKQSSLCSTGGDSE